RILERFVHQICGCEARWTPGNIIEASIAQIREQVGKEEVILGLSGGTDSAVVAALLNKAIGKQLICVFVNTGLLRLNESEQILKTFEEHFGIHVVHVNAEERFYKILENVSDPEQKRKIIGNEFVKIFEEHASKFKNAKWLAQG